MLNKIILSSFLSIFIYLEASVDQYFSLCNQLNYYSSLFSLAENTPGGKTTLMLLAEKGDISEVKKLVENKAKLFQRDRNGDTAKGIVEKEFDKLISKGTGTLQDLENMGRYRDIIKFLEDAENKTRIEISELINNDKAEELSKIIKQNGIDLNLEFVRTGSPTYGLPTPILMVAVQEKKSSVIAFLLKQGANPNVILTDPSVLGPAARPRGATRNYEVSPLIEATRENQLEIMKLLLEARANPNLKTSYLGDSAILNVKSIDAIDLLLKYKANINAQDKKGDTALMHVADDLEYELIERLLSLGADPCIKNVDKLTALDVANKGRTDKISSAEALASYGLMKNSLKERLFDIQKKYDLIKNKLEEAMKKFGC